MAATKKWAQKEGIPVWEAESHLDSKLFLDEYPRWRADGPQCPCILQRMFAYAKEVGCKEWEQTIHRGCQQPIPRRNLRWKLWLSRWWDSRPPGRRSRGSIMRYTNKRGYWAPHHMGHSGWRPLIEKSVLLWKRYMAEVGYHQTRRRSEGSHHEHFAAHLPGQIPLLDLGKEWGPTQPGPQGS